MREQENGRNRVLTALGRRRPVRLRLSPLAESGGPASAAIREEVFRGVSLLSARAYVSCAAWGRRERDPKAVGLAVPRRGAVKKDPLVCQSPEGWGAGPSKPDRSSSWTRPGSGSKPHPPVQETDAPDARNLPTGAGSYVRGHDLPGLDLPRRLPTVISPPSVSGARIYQAKHATGGTREARSARPDIVDASITRAQVWAKPG